MIKPFIIFDLESTGTSVTKDRIVSLAAKKVDREFNEVSPMRTILINPQMPIPAQATEVHGITDEMVKGAGTFAAYSKALAEYFEGCDLAGYNLKSFDVPLLSEEFARVGVIFPAPGTLIFDSYKIFSIKERRDLTGALKFYAGEAMEGAHDAGNDVLATEKVLKGQFAMYDDLREMDSEALHEFCNDGKKPLDIAGKIVLNEQGVAVYGFGKDEGKTVQDNPGFGLWMLKNDFPSDTKKVLNQLLIRAGK